MADEFLALAEQTSQKHKMAIETQLVSSFAATAFHPDCQHAIQQAAEHLGYTHMPAVSGAGHDAVYAARLAPTGMIFIPCTDGISHNEAEDISQEWATMGTNVLMHAVLEKAEVIG